MSSRNYGSDDTSNALTLFEKKTLAETRKYTQKCGNKIAEDKNNFAQKGAFGLWWDAKGIFNCSDAEDVTAHMERYRKFYKKMDDFSEQVEKGDPNSYMLLMEIYKELEEIEKDAKRDVENTQSSAVCQMLREFLDKKYNLDHSLKKVECIVMKQKMGQVEQTCKTSTDTMRKMSEKMDEHIKRKNSEMEALMERMRREKEELASEADRRCEAIRRESEERLRQAVEEANRRSDARMQEMAEQNRALVQELTEQNRIALQMMSRMFETMNLSRTSETQH